MKVIGERFDRDGLPSSPRRSPESGNSIPEFLPLGFAGFLAKGFMKSIKGRAGTVPFHGSV
jgi:hypothetical protein